MTPQDMAGTTFPGLNARKPFAAGLSTDGPLTPAALGMVATCVAAIRGRVATRGTHR